MYVHIYLHPHTPTISAEKEQERGPSRKYRFVGLPVWKIGTKTTAKVSYRKILTKCANIDPRPCFVGREAQSSNACLYARTGQADEISKRNFSLPRRYHSTKGVLLNVCAVRMLFVLLVAGLG